ncbi:MAG: transposase [Nitrososphaerales archaeon]
MLTFELKVTDFKSAYTTDTVSITVQDVSLGMSTNLVTNKDADVLGEWITLTVAATNGTPVSGESLHARGGMPKKLSVIEQKGDLDGWKHKHEYGYRWIAESVFSAFKRTFGEHVKAVRWNNMVKELMLKASIYNMAITMNPKWSG